MRISNKPSNKHNPAKKAHSLSRVNAALNTQDGYVYMAILFILSIVLQVSLAHPYHNFGGDFSQYIAQAIALVDGKVNEQIANNTYMMSMCDSVYGPYVYPWGFPLLIAPIYATFSFSLYAFKYVGILCFSAFVAGFYRFCISNGLTLKQGFIATLFFAINPLFVHFANNIISDMPFLCASFFALICLNKMLFAINGGGGETKSYLVDYRRFAMLCRFEYSK